MKHLNVGQTQERPIAACGAWIPRLPERDKGWSGETTTVVLQRVDCSDCLVALDLMTQAGGENALVGFMSRGSTNYRGGRKKKNRSWWELKVEVDERAFPFAPPPCPHPRIAGKWGWSAEDRAAYGANAVSKNLGVFCESCGAGPLTRTASQAADDRFMQSFNADLEAGLFYGSPPPAPLGPPETLMQSMMRGIQRLRDMPRERPVLFMSRANHELLRRHFAGGSQTGYQGLQLNGVPVMISERIQDDEVVESSLPALDMLGEWLPPRELPSIAYRRFNEGPLDGQPEGFTSKTTIEDLGE